jgi:hypothetical protein
MITYLNEGWKHEYGGQLELWNSDATHCEKSIEPEFNRTILFEVGDKNFHGVRPVLTEDGRSRRSFAFYFHTIPNGAETAHNSIYAPNFYLKRDPVKEYVLDFVPPVLLKAVRRIKSTY